MKNLSSNDSRHKLQNQKHKVKKNYFFDLSMQNVKSAQQLKKNNFSTVKQKICKNLVGEKNVKRFKLKK